MTPSWMLVFHIFYCFLAALAGLAVRSGRSKNLQIIVLRHQIQVLRRRIGRPAVNNNDQTLLAAIAAALPHRLRQGWILTPDPPDATASSTSTRMQPDQGRLSFRAPQALGVSCSAWGLADWWPWPRQGPRQRPLEEVIRLSVDGAVPPVPHDITDLDTHTVCPTCHSVVEVATLQNRPEID